MEGECVTVSLSLPIGLDCNKEDPSLRIKREAKQHRIFFIFSMII